MTSVTGSCWQSNWSWKNGITGWRDQRPSTPALRGLDQPQEPVLHPDCKAAELTSGQVGAILHFDFTLTYWPGSWTSSLTPYPDNSAWRKESRERKTSSPHLESSLPSPGRLKMPSSRPSSNNQTQEEVPRAVFLSLMLSVHRYSNGLNPQSSPVDCFSKAAHFDALTKLPTARETADLLITHIVRLHGIPLDIVSDRGPYWLFICPYVGPEQHWRLRSRRTGNQRTSTGLLPPSILQKIINPSAVRLKLPSSMRIHPTFHVSQIKPVATRQHLA
ncbi:hypothetical protein L3Q82_015069 [Scortum barcoo]|uniref:Uncharacterized protein n=1 Tax=Scortum barcoo TaxID=214431 RepID=A0ACB8VT53_9TELE|nr:hypothetical protein L3Q82_015069 [Scortum barcoo]